MISLLAKIDSLTVPAPQPGVEPKLDDATIVVTMEPNNVGTITLKVYPAACGEFAVGPCRVMVDQG